MTASNGHIFRVTGHLCGDFTGPRWIPNTKPVTRRFDVFFDVRLKKNGWVNNREAGNLRRYRGHYDVIIMSRGKGDDLHDGNDHCDRFVTANHEAKTRKPHMSLSCCQNRVLIRR